jgi:hypothetical protein
MAPPALGASFGACQAPSSAVGEGKERGDEVEGQGEAVGFAEFVRRDALAGCSCKPKTTSMHGRGHV